MRIRHVSIRNFRGIRILDWLVDGTVRCLIGPGNSTKTTVLDAIEYTLSPRWSISFDDTDFYDVNIDNAIEIIVTVSNLPIEFLHQDRFGMNLRGIGTAGLIDEPDPDTKREDYALSIQLRVDRSLEPEWTVINSRLPEPKRISARDRASLAVTRLGENSERHLTWSKGSILVGLTNSDDDAADIMAEATRSARNQADFSSVPDLTSAIEQVTRNAERLSVKPQTRFQAALDARSLVTSFGAIALHDGKVPLRLAGLGTRRLLAMAAQLSSIEKGAILLVDEIESGLEPHRVRALIRLFQSEVSVSDTRTGQVLMTSHSPTVLAELDAYQLAVVRSNDGETRVLSVDPNLQGTVRYAPEAFLGQRIVICEGATEYGLCIGLEASWIQKKHPPLAYFGVTVIDGGGHNAAARALHLAGLGYHTCLFMDGDRLATIEPPLDRISSMGVQIIHWGDEMCTEECIVSSLAWDGICDIVNLAIEHFDEQRVLDSLAHKLQLSPSAMTCDPNEWISETITKDRVRAAVGETAKKKNGSSGLNEVRLWRE